MGTAPIIASAPASARSKAPVFVLGCPRSGTTLLYHMLLSTRNFVMYPTESQAFNLLEPRFGNLRVARNRRRLLAEWEKSSLFTCTGLEARQVEKDTADCENVGSFLRKVMESMAHMQGVERWAECTPDHLLALPRIKQTIPDALVIHIIRDGRDVALSLARQQWIRPLPWDRDKQLHTAALFWEWIVNRGREHGKALGGDYKEIRYEDLVDDPRSTLASVGQFIGQDLDYDQILRVGIGSVRKPNSSFGKEGSNGNFRPVARWKKFMTPGLLDQIETLIGKTLVDLGYELDRVGRGDASLTLMRTLYQAYFSTKLILKNRTPMGRLFGSDLEFLGLQAEGPTRAPDALREPSRILQIENLSVPAGNIPVMLVAEELRRRGHFCEVLKIREARQVDDSGCVAVNNTPDYLQKIFSFSMRGYQLNVHLSGMSKKAYWSALAAALTGCVMSRPVLVTFHGGLGPTCFSRYDRRVAHQALRALFQTAGAVACDDEATREAIGKYGVRLEKVRVVAQVREHPSGAVVGDVPALRLETSDAICRMVDWLTGDLPQDAPSDSSVRTRAS